MREEKFQKLPLHHIDTSVILEPKDVSDNIYRKKYLNLVGYKYRGRLSFPALGELFFKIQKLETFREQYEILDMITELIKKRRISFFSVPENEGINVRIKELDRRVDKTDRLILASAIEDGATFFVTLDSKLVDNMILEKEFGISIKHPKDLI